MFASGARRYLVVDAQVHALDGSPHNQACPAGEQLVADLYDRHRALDGRPRPVPADEFARVGEAELLTDLFAHGHVDRAVLQPLGYDDLFVLGFSPASWHAELAAAPGPLHGRVVLVGELDPDARHAAQGLTARIRRQGLRGLSLLPARRPELRVGLAAPALRRTLVRADGAGAGVVQLGVTPSAHPPPGAPDWAHLGIADRATRRGRPRWPSWAEPVRAGSALPVRVGKSRPAPAGGFDPGELAALAGALPRVRFVVGAGWLPPDAPARLARHPNVFVLLTDLLVALRAAHPSAGAALDGLLEAFGPGRLLFGSGYPLVRPGALVAQTVTALSARGVDPAGIQAILATTAARLYDVQLPGSLATPLRARETAF